MTHSSFIAVYNFWLWLKALDQTILQNCRLSLSDEEISQFWLNFPGLLVSANNLPVLEYFSDAPRQNSLSQVILNTPLALCFATVFF